jgi:hypothetical protein
MEDNPMTTRNLSRRTLIAGAAVLSTTAAVATTVAVPSAPAAAPPDPIFAAIERHKEAFRPSLEAARVKLNTVSAEWAENYDAAAHEAAEAAAVVTSEAEEDAANALTTIRPTTMAGILALIRYVAEFNAGAFFLEPWPEDTVADWQSAPHLWPASFDDDGIDMFGYSVLANVRTALEGLAS